jgi:hypothetical protein
MNSGNWEPTALISSEPTLLCEPQRNDLASNKANGTDEGSCRQLAGAERVGICKTDKAEAGVETE